MLASISCQDGCSDTIYKVKLGTIVPDNKSTKHTVVMPENFHRHRRSHSGSSANRSVARRYTNYRDTSNCVHAKCKYYCLLIIQEVQCRNLGQFKAKHYLDSDDVPSNLL